MGDNDNEQRVVGERTALYDWLHAHGLDLRFSSQRDLLMLLTETHHTDPLPIANSYHTRVVPLRRLGPGRYLSECGRVRVERNQLLGEKEWTVISQEFFSYAPTLRTASLKAGQLLAMESVEEELKASRAFSLVRNDEQRRRRGWQRRRVLGWLRQS